jgi:hypothetical protein
MPGSSRSSCGASTTEQDERRMPRAERIGTGHPRVQVTQVTSSCNPLARAATT